MQPNEKTAGTAGRHGIETARFRFGLIAPVVQGTLSERSAAEYFRRVTAGPVKGPDGKEAKYSFKTLQKWVSDYRRRGYDALVPRERSDKGRPRRLGETAVQRIYELKGEFPRMNATQMRERLLQEGLIDARTSESTLQRFYRKNGLRQGIGAPGGKDRKAFEEDAFGKMWQADTKHMRRIKVGGEPAAVYNMTIIDDHSRLVVGGELFLSDSAANFQKVLKDAVTAYGAPQKLYVDNGAPYCNDQLSLICIELGIVLIHAKPRDGASKGKIERYWRTLDERFNYINDFSGVESLEKYNSMYRQYVRMYNTTGHSAIGEAPQQRYMRTRDAAARKKGIEEIERCFHNRIVRKVRKDSTISLDGKSYDVPFQFIGEKVEVRYMPSDMSGAYILRDGERHPISETDKNANARAKRTAPAIDYEKLGGAK